MEIAQEEVLTCIGMCIYNRLKRIQQCVKEEENACQVLGAVAVYALCRSFDMAVENKRGINLELIYDEINREERVKEQKKEAKKLKKRKKRNEKKHLLDEEGCNLGCDPEPVGEKCACSSSDLHFDDDEEMDDGHSHGENEDDDEDGEEKIVLCDGTIIDVGPGQGKIKVGKGHKHAQPTNHLKNCSNEHLLVDLVKDEVSVSSCHSCNNDTDGPCTQRSLDGGYESHHDSGSCCMSSSNNNSCSSRTSSIASTPEGSEVACSDACCNSNSAVNGNGKNSKRTAGDGNSDCGLVMSLEQMLLVSLI